MISFDNFKNIFKHINSLCWKNNVEDRLTFEIAYNYFFSLSPIYSKNKNLIRLIGQSGSGKTTQLLPTANALMNSENLKPFTVCVRDYAKLHPNYNNLLNKYGKGEIREKTNCFALKCLVVNLILAIQYNYDIIFEVTLLTNKFEQFVNDFLRLQKYKIINLCVAINKKMSNFLIKNRKNSENSLENNRIVYKSSSNFFYKTLYKGMKYYTKKQPNTRIIIWNVFDNLPVYDGYFKSCYSIFIINQKVNKINLNNQKDLLNSKINYVLNNVKLN